MQIAQCTLKENKMIRQLINFQKPGKLEMEIKRRGKYYILYAEQQRVHKTIFITNYAIKERKISLSSKREKKSQSRILLPEKISYKN